MSSWSYALTNKGRQLQAKAQAGAHLVYTRMAVGSGTLSGQSLESMTALITPVKDLAISRLKRPAGSTRALIGATLTNQDVTTGFYLREIGIFATDPDDGEILYMYANAGATADYITPQGDGVIEKALNMNVFVGSAANITANIDESLVYATQQDLADAIAGIQINDATTTQKGIVQLSNATNSTAEDRAATPKAVKSAYDAAVAAQTAANAANTAAANAGAKADSAMTLLADLPRYAVDLGTANAKVVNFTSNVPTSYFEGMAIAFKNKVQNTGAVTINVNGLGTKSILKSNGSTLASGNLKADSIYTIRYNGTNFILQGEGGEEGLTKNFIHLSTASVSLTGASLITGSSPIDEYNIVQGNAGMGTFSKNANGEVTLQITNTLANTSSNPIQFTTDEVVDLTNVSFLIFFGNVIPGVNDYSLSTKFGATTTKGSLVYDASNTHTLPQGYSQMYISVVVDVRGLSGMYYIAGQLSKPSTTVSRTGWFYLQGIQIVKQ